jgi:hypothetical protein
MAIFLGICAEKCEQSQSTSASQESNITALIFSRMLSTALTTAMRQI